VADLLPALAGPIDNGVESFTHSPVARIVHVKDHRRALVGAGLVIGLALALLVVLAIIGFLGRPVEAAPPPRPAPE
jgi:hypothetical protein